MFGVENGDAIGKKGSSFVAHHDEIISSLSTPVSAKFHFTMEPPTHPIIILTLYPYTFKHCTQYSKSYFWSHMFVIQRITKQDATL